MDDEPSAIPDAASCDPSDAPMTVEERQLAKSLVDCPFDPGTVSDEFHQFLMEVTDSQRGRLTSPQRACLWRLGHQYHNLLPETIQSILNFRDVPR